MLNPSFDNDFLKIDFSKNKIDSNFNISYSKSNSEKIKEVSQEFESLLVYEMYKEMNKNISFQNKDYLNKNDEFIKKNQAEKIFCDLLTYEQGKLAVKSNNLNFGLSDIIIEQLKYN